jgi:hypothetical protein
MSVAALDLNLAVVYAHLVGVIQATQLDLAVAYTHRKIGFGVEGTHEIARSCLSPIASLQ